MLDSLTQALLSVGKVPSNMASGLGDLLSDTLAGFQTWRKPDPKTKARELGQEQFRKANDKYKFSPRFAAIAEGMNPEFYQYLDASQRPAGADAAIAAYDPAPNISHIKLSPSKSPDSLFLHEALHSAYDLVPKKRQQWLDETRKGQWRKPELMKWLDERLSIYQGYKGPESLQDDLGFLDPGVFEEVHSMIPEYYAQQPKPTLPQGLEGYYGQYLDPVDQGDYPQL